MNVITDNIYMVFKIHGVQYILKDPLESLKGWETHIVIKFLENDYWMVAEIICHFKTRRTGKTKENPHDPIINKILANTFFFSMGGSYSIW